MSDLEEDKIKTISPKTAFKLIKGHEDFTLIDLRTPEEFSTEHIDGAENMDYYDRLK